MLFYVTLYNNNNTMVYYYDVWYHDGCDGNGSSCPLLVYYTLGNLSGFRFPISQIDKVEIALLLVCHMSHILLQNGHK